MKKLPRTPPPMPHYTTLGDLAAKIVALEDERDQLRSILRQVVKLLERESFYADHMALDVAREALLKE